MYERETDFCGSRLSLAAAAVTAYVANYRPSAECQYRGFGAG